MFFTRRRKQTQAEIVDITVTKRRAVVSNAGFTTLKNRLLWRSDCTNDEIAQMHVRYRDQFHSHHPTSNDSNRDKDNTKPSVPPMIYDSSDSSTSTTVSSVSTVAKSQATYVGDDDLLLSCGALPNCFFFDQYELNTFSVDNEE